MKKLASAVLTTLIISTTQAGYTIKVPLEGDQGGSLPSGTVQFVTPTQLPQNPALPTENWQPHTPEYSVWVDNGPVSGCTNWAPATSTVLLGQVFTQTATDCNQEQTRTKQETEMDLVTLTIRNVGAPTIESQIITISATRTVNGTNPKESRYDESNRAFTFGTTGNYMFTWGGDYIGGGGKSITAKGYRYSASTLKKSEKTCDFGACTVTHYYEISREPL